MHSTTLSPTVKASDTLSTCPGDRTMLLVVVLVGLLSLAPVQQDIWWQQSTLLPHFLMVADWSKSLILGLAGQWLAGGLPAQGLPSL